MTRKQPPTGPNSLTKQHQNVVHHRKNLPYRLALPPPKFGPSPGVARLSASSESRRIESPTKQKHPPYKVFGLTPEDRVPSAKELEEAACPRFQDCLRTWYLRFNELIDYRETHGDCEVPQKYKPKPKLGYWVNKQRMDKKEMDDGKKTAMSEAKFQKLEKLGFRWAKHRGATGWILQYNNLCAYYREHGHSDYPTKCQGNTALGRWVSTQRSEYKKFLDGQSQYMTTERVEQLNAIKFKWNASCKWDDPSNSAWRAKRSAPASATKELDEKEDPPDTSASVD